MAEPTFIGIGVQKCATTWVYEVLAEHPQIGVSRPKELDFFSLHYARGLSWYESHFDHAACAGRKARGEISPSYFHTPDVERRIKAYAPDSRLILCLRDPVQRVLSNHAHEVRIGGVDEKHLSLDACLERKPEYIEQGRYATHLKRWLRCFPLEQIFVILYDDIASSPEAVVRDLYAFLDVDGDFLPHVLHRRSNASHAYRSKPLEKLRKNFKHGAQAVGLGGLWRTMGDIGGQRIYRYLNKRPPSEVIPQVGEPTLARLWSQFEPEVSELESLIARPLDAWKRYPGACRAR